MAILAKVARAGVATAAKVYVRITAVDLVRKKDGSLAATAQVEAREDADAAEVAIRSTVPDVPVTDDGSAGLRAQIYAAMKLQTEMFQDAEDA